MNNIFPISVKMLYESCIYSSITHAVANIKFPYLAYEQSWCGNNYSYITDLARGTVTFDFEHNLVVGAARDERNKRILLYPKMQAISLFNEAPAACKELALNEPLQYLLNVVDGITMPCATTSLWNVGDQIVSCDTFDGFAQNGGDFLKYICVPMPDIRECCIEQYDFSDTDVELVEHIFQLKKSGQSHLNKRMLSFADTKSAGYRECIASLNEIGIIV